MASPDDGAVSTPGSGTVFDQIHRAAGGRAPQSIFDQLHAQAVERSSSAAPASSTSPPATPPAAERTLGGFISNIPASAAKFGGNLWDAGRLAVGAGERAQNLFAPDANRSKGPEEQDFDKVLAQVTGHPVDTLKGVGQYFKDKYGGWDKARTTAYEDPVGFAADLSTVLGGAGTGLRVASTVGRVASLGRVADILGDVGNVASKASEIANPLTAPGKAIRAVAGNQMTSAAKSLYQGALKPNLNNGAEANEAIAQMGLEQRIPLNKNAPARGRQIAEATQAQTNDLIKHSPAQIDPVDVANSAEQQFRAPIASSATPTRDLQQFDRETADYLAQHTPKAQPTTPSGLLGPDGRPAPTPSAPRPQAYPIQEAQAEKVNTYKKINSYGDQASPEQEANKGLAFGLKTAMEKFIPELKGLNEKEATAIGLDGALQRFTAREGNGGRLLRFLRPDLASGAVAGLVGTSEHSVPAAVGAHLVTKALEDPGVQSRIAIALYKTANRPGTPYIRQGMTPASRIAEVKDHIQALQQQPQQPDANPAPSENVQATHPALAGLPQPDEAAANASAQAQRVVNQLQQVGQHVQGQSRIQQ